MHIHVVLDVSVSMGGSCGQGALMNGLTDSCALQVNQGNMPGIQSTFLAMDTEEGVEVVWNELLFTDKKAFKAHEVIAPDGEECAHGSLCLLYPKSSFSPDLEPLPTFLCSLWCPAMPQSCHLSCLFSAYRRRSRPCLSSWCWWTTPTS